MSNKVNLFDDNSDDDDGDTSLTVNKDYAKRYEEWREAEVKRHLEDKYGNEYEDLTSSSSDDDPDPEELKQVMSKDFLELISSLRKKDPKIYNSDVKFFKDEKEAAKNPAEKSTKSKEKEKPLYLRDYERKIITERQGELSDESDIEDVQDARSQSPTYMEEQQQIKESFKKALYDDEDGDSDDGGILKKKTKTKEEKKKEEEDYIEWLKGEKESLGDKETEKSLDHLKSQWSDPQLDEGEKFLRDYILNKRYLEQDEPVDAGNVTDDDYQDEYMNEFERKYNFRYEEPDRDFLKRYPRTMEQSMRLKDTRRKDKREALKQRKEEEKQRKREELKVLKSLKRKEIMQKIEKIKAITGNEELGLNPDELEDDFDPEAHDKKMKELFNDEYYGEADNAEDEEGLNLPPLEEDLLDDGIADGNWDNWDGTHENAEADGGNEGDPHCEDPEFNMDCDYDPAAAAREKEEKPSRKSAREKRKLKRQSRFGRLVHKEKPVFDPNDKTFQQWVDEYYGMDYEDLIGDIPCRYKYRSVFPNSFGLTIDEILAADDKELNQWASIKKATTIRPDRTEIYEAKAYAQKAQDEALKRKILPSLFKHETENQNQKDKKKKKKKKKETSFEEVPEESFYETKPKKKAKKEATGEEDFSEIADQHSSEPQAEGSSKKKKKKDKNLGDFTNEPDATLAEETNDSQVEGSGKRKKKKEKYANGCETTVAESANETLDSSHSEPQVEGSSKKKKKKDKNSATHASEGNSAAVKGVNAAVGQQSSASQAEGGSKKKKIKKKNPADQANGNSNKFASNKAKRKRTESGVEQQNGGKKARRSFGQGDGGKKNFKKQDMPEQNISDERLKAFGFNPRKFKNKLKYGPKK